MTFTRVTGDVHGHTKQYANMLLEDEVPYSVQIGDMGFHYKDLDVLDSERHKFYGGNHDNYDFYDWNLYSLGDYGEVNLGPLDFFFIRGAFSIDVKYRLERQAKHGIISWWDREQLNKKEMQSAYNAYKKAKPNIMMTHDCPIDVSKRIGSAGALKAFGFDPETFTTATQELFDRCFEEHKPDIWVFGHFHMDLEFDIDGTTFICLDELSSMDYVNGEFKNRICRRVIGR